jgi:hypothetical protein
MLSLSSFIMSKMSLSTSVAEEGVGGAGFVVEVESGN